MLLRPRLRPSTLLLEADSICVQYLRRLQSPPRTVRRAISTSAPTRDAAATQHNGLKRGYFLGNGLIEEALRSSRGQLWNLAALKRASTAAAATEHLPQSQPTAPQRDTSLPITDREELPHRRRKRLKELEKQKQAAGENGQFMPPDASSRLSSLSQALPQQSLKARAMAFLSLAKPRLSFLIVLTTTTAYSTYPVTDVLSPSATTAPSLSTLTLTFLTIGTSLACASANTFNMLFELKYDAIMSRTRNRPLVRGLLTKRAAAIFGVLTGLLGVSALYFGVNPTTAALGAANIILYAGVYTPMKRLSAANTWAGAIVGGIPPLMGCTAAAGQVSTSTEGESQWQELLFGKDSLGGWLLAGLLFAWQFPHFNALSWPVREEYKAAGHRMLAWTNPARNARVALRYAVLMFPLCWGLSAAGVVEPWFVPASAVVNGWMVYEAVKFWRFQGYKGSARGLFWASVWHMPGILVLAMAAKKGLWGRVWTGVFGVGEEDEWED